MTNPNDPAFNEKRQFGLPPDDKPNWGLTKREYFAALAMRGYLHQYDYERCAHYAAEMADALIAELNKEKS